MIESMVLANLVKDEEYTRRVLPFLKSEYFTTTSGRTVFTIIEQFVQTYKIPPTVEAIEIELEKSSLTGTAHTDAKKYITDISTTTKIDDSRRPWLIDETEKFCKHRAIYLGISEAIDIIDNSPDKVASVPDILKDALSVGFTTNIGHDYFEDIETRYNLYHQQRKLIPFDLEHFNKITRGGLSPKTLNVIVAGTNVGKSLFLCHVGASTIAQGKDVLYITLEMAEERIAQRIDANLLDITMDTLEQMPLKTYQNAFQKIQQRQKFGKLIIKEYPTSAGHIGHFRALLDELALKKKFVPDLLIVDYINICSSVRFKANGQTNSYTYVKSIAEELRGLAVEYNVPCLTATQFNREGYDTSDPSLTNTSESFGLPQTADLQVALITNEELQQEGLLMVKQLKNRYEDISKFRRFTIKVDKSKMRLATDKNQNFISEPLPSNIPKQNHMKTDDWRMPDEEETIKSEFQKQRKKEDVSPWKITF